MSETNGAWGEENPGVGTVKCWEYGSSRDHILASSHMDMVALLHSTVCQGRLWTTCPLHTKETCMVPMQYQEMTTEHCAGACFCADFAQRTKSMQAISFFYFFFLLFFLFLLYFSFYFPFFFNIFYFPFFFLFLFVIFTFVCVLVFCCIFPFFCLFLLPFLFLLFFTFVLSFFSPLVYL
jgi:hypothetical protein